MSKLIRMSNDETKGIFQSGNSYALVDLETNTVVSSGTNLEDLCTNNEWEIPSTLVAAGMSSSERRRKAQKQPRDSNGRFVGAGANVKYFSNGTEWSGTVDAIRDGKAFVSVRLPNGAVSQRQLDPNTLSVYTSKARIPSDNKVEMEDEDFDGFIARHRPKSDEAPGTEPGTEPAPGGNSPEAVNIMGTSPSGYSVDMKKRAGEQNALMFQLYAPSGDSMGIYSEVGGTTSLNDVVESHRDAGEGTEAPASSETVVVSSGYPVPDDVRMTALAYLERNQDNLSEEQLSVVASLANDDRVKDDVLIAVQDFFSELEELMKMYGGENAKDWSKSAKEYPIHDFDREENMDYFAVASDSSFSDVHLVAVDSFTGNVLGWENGKFCFDLGNIDTFDSEHIIPLDPQSAKEVAFQLGNTETSFSNMFLDERTLFNLASDEIDFGELDRIATLAYESSDRSYDAGSQNRSSGGKFVEAANPQASGDDTKYFAIVDSTDQDAVLDTIAIQNKGGAVSVFKREGGIWVPSPELQEQVQGATPPAVRVLEDEETLKSVLSQVDSYDLEDAPAPEEMVASAIFTSVDLERYMELGGPYTDYAYKRAKALNRLDLVPEDWRLEGAFSATNNDMFGEFGEVITASGFGADTTNLEKLESYWLKGKGSEKISWGTDFALSEGYKVFSKFLGTQRAFAFATILNNKYSGV